MKNIITVMQPLVIITESKIFRMFSRTLALAWRMWPSKKKEMKKEKRSSDLTLDFFHFLPVKRQLKHLVYRHFVNSTFISLFIASVESGEYLGSLEEIVRGRIISCLRSYTNKRHANHALSLSRGYRLMSSSLCPHYCRNLAHIFV